MSKRRVVVTGLGAVTPVGNNVQTFWENVKTGKIGIGEITRFDTADFKVKLAAEVKDFNAKDYMDFKAAKRMELFSQYAVAASKEAMADAGIEMGKEDPFRVGVIVGSGIGSLQAMESADQRLIQRGPSKVDPLLVPKMISNMAAGNVSIALGARGKCTNVVTACASGTHCIGDAFRASIPFDKERGGFVIGEGAGVVVLEELEHAKARGAKIYAEVVGYGATADAYHITSPIEDGSGAAHAMTDAMKEAGVQPEEIDYINAHGTGTHHNDLFETRAIKAALGDAAKKVKINSTKSMIGHLLGAAGGVEAVVCVKSIEEGFIHQTVGTKETEEELDLDYCIGGPTRQEVNYAMSNSLGFGGHNAVLLMKKYR